MIYDFQKYSIDSFLFAGNAFAWDDVKVGSVITLGRYPQTASEEIKPIEWRVLEIKDSKALLLADKGLDVAPYNTEWEPVSWKTCTIRQWLNADFYNKAFNDSEKSRIVITVVNVSDFPEIYKDAAKFNGITNDRIFLLSADEVGKYFKNDDELRVKLTAYADSKDGSSGWWLRSRGYSIEDAMISEIFIARVSDMVHVKHVVRPALWVNLN